MTNKETIEQYVDLIMSMSLAFKMDQIDKETYLTNLKLVVDCIQGIKILQ